MRTKRTSIEKEIQCILKHKIFSLKTFFFRVYWQEHEETRRNRVREKIANVTKSLSQFLVQTFFFFSRANEKEKERTDHVANQLAALRQKMGISRRK